MTKTALPKWTDERTDTLTSLIGDTTPVTPEVVQLATDTLGEGTTNNNTLSSRKAT